MPAKRIAIIGGASAYTPGIIEGFIREAPSLAGSDIVLMDIDSERLRTVWRLAKQMVRAAGVKYGVNMTLDRQVALKNADFVLTQFRAGGLAARALDERIPMQHGLIGQETVGAGGLAFAWRAIPIALETAREMSRLCPDAWLINYANPTRQVTEAILRDGAFTRVIGLCDEPIGVKYAIARLIRVAPDRLSIDNYGINHCGWINDISLDGRPIMNRLRLLARLAPAALIPDYRVAAVVNLLRRYGAIASPYLAYFYAKDQMLARQRRAARTRAEEIMAELPDIYAHYEAQAATVKPHLTRRRGVAGHGDLAVSVIASLACDRNDEHIVNVPGRGAMPGFAPSAVVELRARVGADGATPLPVPDVAPSLARLIHSVAFAEELNIEAAMSGSVARAVAAMTAHPLVGPEHAKAVTADLMAAHRSHLPQFPE